MRHPFGTTDAIIEFPGQKLALGMKEVRMCFLELFGKGFAIDPNLLAELLQSFLVTPLVNESDVDINLTFNPTMTVTQVFLGVNTVNDVNTRTETDISVNISGNSLNYTYVVGAPFALRYYWVRLVDGSGNESINPLGAYTTQDNTPPVISAFTLTAGNPSTTEIDVAITATDNDAVQTLYLWVSDTQTTVPSAVDIKANGVALAGTTTIYPATGLTPNTTYYGWLLAKDNFGNESAVAASTPATLTTAADVTPPVLDSFNLTATPGSEETAVNITLSFSDTVA